MVQNKHSTLCFECCLSFSFALTIASPRKSNTLMAADDEVSTTVTVEGLLVLQVFNGQSGNVLWPS